MPAEHFEREMIDSVARLEVKVDRLIEDVAAQDAHRRKFVGLGGIAGLFAGFLSGITAYLTGIGPSS
jgi:hypothetical protein